MDFDTYLLSAQITVLVAGQVLILVQAFRVSLGWGLFLVIVPLAPILFVPIQWREARVPFFLWLAGIGSLAVRGPTNGDYPSVVAVSFVLLLGLTGYVAMKAYREDGHVLPAPAGEEEPEPDARGNVLGLSEERD